MESLLIEIAKQCPGIAALVAVVVLFLRHQRQADERRAPLDQEIAQTLRANTAALARNAAVLERVERGFGLTPTPVPSAFARRPRAPGDNPNFQ